MKWNWFLVSLAVLAFAGKSSCEDGEILQPAEACNLETCKLPDCRCSSTNIPGNLTPRNTPQFVTVTFDDAVTIGNMDTYRDLFYDRKNMNNCPAGATFFVSHEYTNYQFINELYNRGYEIALHSISHRTPQTWWRDASVEDLVAEFGGQKIILSRFANIPRSAIHGVRSPFLQMAGNASFQMMKEVGLTYDCSWPTSAFTNPGLWPYTLDHSSTQDCNIPPCPTASFGGIWVKPMVNWHDLKGQFCSMADQCFHENVPDLTDEDAWFRFIVANFERHYLNNRAPFGYYVHEGYLRTNPAVYRALVRFLDMINNIPDVFMVNVNDVIDWVKNPVPVNEYMRQPCKVPSPSLCMPPMSCGPLRSTHTPNSFWMAACGPCPARYPWLDDPLGLTPLPQN